MFYWKVYAFVSTLKTPSANMFYIAFHSCLVSGNILFNLFEKVYELKSNPFLMVCLHTVTNYWVLFLLVYASTTSLVFFVLWLRDASKHHWCRVLLKKLLSLASRNANCYDWRLEGLLCDEFCTSCCVFCSKPFTQTRHDFFERNPALYLFMRVYSQHTSANLHSKRVSSLCWAIFIPYLV